MKLKELISVKLAGNIMIVGLILLALFHLLVMLKLLPANIVWAGQVADSEPNLLQMELIALAVTLLFMTVVAIRLDYLQKGKFKLVSRIGIWVILVVFSLSTIGNIFSNVSAEKLIFTPLSVILTILAFRLAIDK